MTFLMQQELLMRKLGWIKGTTTEWPKNISGVI
jgi:hypothetical protein